MKVGVIGSGAWGTAIANVMAANGHKVTLYATNRDVYDTIRAERVNRHYLPELVLEENLTVTLEPDELRHVECAVWGTPVQYLRSRAREFSNRLPGARLFINLAKGLEAGSFQRPSQIFGDVFGDDRVYSTLAGPNIASEVALGQYTETTVAVERSDHDTLLQSLFHGPQFHINIQRDLAGLEFVGAFKNIAAIIGGTCDVRALGDNAKSLLIARAWREATMVATRFGATEASFYSVTAIADLYATAHSKNGRNRRIGEMLATGHSIQNALERLDGRVAEGIATAQILEDMAKSVAVETPLTAAICALIKGSATVEDYWNKVFGPR